MGADCVTDCVIRRARPTGNWGLLDNVAALKWIHSNIAAFGGDPDNVMIFGESSGAGSVSQLLGIEAAWPYFHKAVMESGTAAFWTYLPLENAQQSYAAVLGATGCASAVDKVDCLLGAGSNGFMSAVTSVPCRDGCTWAPTIDVPSTASSSLIRHSAWASKATYDPTRR